MWTGQVDELYRNNTFTSKVVFNSDETGIDPNFIGRELSAIVSADGPMPYQLKVPSVDRISIVPIVSADGLVYLIAFILPSIREDATDHSPLPEEFLAESRGLPQMLYFFTPPGYMNGEIWHSICKAFGELASRIHPGLEKLLIIDGLNAHKTDSSLHACIDSQVQTLVLPENTTHILQPLDQFPFANFKLKYSRKWRNALRSMLDHNINPNLLAFKLIKETITEALTPNAIKASFSKTGIWPYQRIW